MVTRRRPDTQSVRRAIIFSLRVSAAELVFYLLRVSATSRLSRVLFRAFASEGFFLLRVSAVHVFPLRVSAAILCCCSGVRRILFSCFARCSASDGSIGVRPGQTSAPFVALDMVSVFEVFWSSRCHPSLLSSFD